jgi:acetyl-CoA carboxylase biotin carboxyl carrier protein
MSGGDLSAEDVAEILRLVEESRFDEFELETPRLSIRFRRAGPSDSPSGGCERAAQASEPRESLSRDSEGLVEITAGMVGTFYRAPAPGAPPFVEVGSRVEPGTQVCIVEVMKLMNAVVADVEGTVAEVCRGDGEPVEYGDVLFRVRTGRA